MSREKRLRIEEKANEEAEKADKLREVHLKPLHPIHLKPLHPIYMKPLHPIHLKPLQSTPGTIDPESCPMTQVAFQQP